MYFNQKTAFPNYNSGRLKAKAQLITQFSPSNTPGTLLSTASEYSAS